MGLLSIATLPARTAIAGAELIIATSRMAARDGPIRRTGGYEERIRVLLATGGAVEQLGRLGDPDGPLARIEELGPLDRSGPQAELSTASSRRWAVSARTSRGSWPWSRPCGRWPTALSRSGTRPRRSARSSSRSPAWPSDFPAGAAEPADSAVSGAPPRPGGLRPLLAQFLGSTADEQSGAELSRAVSTVLTTALVVTNLIGAAVVLVVIYLILPLPRSAMPAPYAGSTRSSRPSTSCAP